MQDKVNISETLLKGLTQEEKENYRKYLLNNRELLDKLVQICYNGIKECENVTEKDYDSPSWAYKQAHLNGKKEAYRKLATILSITERA